MAEPLKDQVSATTIRRLGEALAAVAPAFDVAAFSRAALDGLDALELKARIAHVAAALDPLLPQPFAAGADAVCVAAEQAELTGWEAWPAMTWLERHALEDPGAALDAIGRLTRWISGELAVRPLLDGEPDLTLAVLGEWARSGDVHRRRLASEGTRPRLPWARRLAVLAPDEPRVLELLDVLRDDSSEDVRRSVANHLNDLAKVQPEIALALARRWREEGGAHVDRVLRHGLRTLVKAGDADALRLVGADAGARIEVADFSLEPPVVRIGEAVRLAFELRSRAPVAVRAVVDYVVHHRRARGESKPKVFRLAVVELEPAARRRLERRHAFRELSVRRLYPGTHRVEVQVNGIVRAGGEVTTG